MKRTQLKRKTPLRWKPSKALIKRANSLMRKSRLKPLSTRRAKALKTYTNIRRTLLATRMSCQVGLCTGLATEIHHKAGRDNDRLNDTRNMLPCCAKCHRYIHDFPKWARSYGYILDRIGVQK